jgi:serine phosphatase RsbU (regulator of sigma subunit)
MSLRLRLIVAFFLFSVVPLAAVTFYSYTSNLRALQVAAQHETEMLTGELTQRMQVVTTQVSDRVERLMDMPAAASSAAVTGTSGTAKPAPTRTVVTRSTTRPQVTAPAAPSPPSASSPPATAVAIDPRTIEGQVAGALGEVAMLLNNVEVRGLSRFGGRGAMPAPPGTTQRGTIPSRPLPQDLSSLFRGRGRGGNTRRDAQGTPAPQDAAGRQGPPSDARRESTRGFRPDAPPAAGQREGTPAVPGALLAGTAVEPGADPTHMKLDLTPIRRELFREMAPNGTFDTMTPEERQRVGREVNQRLLGIVQGIQLGAAELQKKAEAAKQQAAAEGVASAAAAAKALAANPVLPVLPGAAKVPAPKPPPPSRTVVAPEKPEQPERPEPPERREKAEQPEKPMTKKAALTGTQLNVRFERDGEIVRQVNAEINLPNLLATVFANTRRDSGEIPFAVGKDGHLYAPNDADRVKLATLDLSRVDGTSGTKRAGNWIVVTMPDRSGAGLRFGIARPVGNLLNDLRRTTARNAGFGLLFIAIALAGMVPLSGRLTRNLTDLTDGVGRIAQGDYSARVPVKSRDEIGRLAAAFNSMASDVEQHQRSAIEQERIRRELELGRRIQADMLPRAPLHFGLTEVKGISVPAREVGGDFFNYFQLDSGLVALLVGDVSGKGVGAALLMANIQASLRTRFALGQGLSAIAEAIDRDIEANSPGPVYATLFIAIFDPATRLMRYVNAGHNPQFVLPVGGGLQKLSSTGLPVGMLAGHGYSEREIQLAPGDLLFFYTDGCVEMENEAGDMFGSDRLESLVAAAARGSAGQVLATVEGAIAAFRGGRDLFDDATMMAVTVG